MNEAWETELIGAQIYGSGIFGSGYYGSVEWTDGITPSATWSNLTDTASTWIVYDQTRTWSGSGGTWSFASSPNHGFVHEQLVTFSTTGTFPTVNGYNSSSSNYYGQAITDDKEFYIILSYSSDPTNQFQIADKTQWEASGIVYPIDGVGTGVHSVHSKSLETTTTWSDTQVGKLATVGTWDDPGDNDDGTYYNINLYGGSGSNAKATVTVTNGIMTNVTLRYTSSTSGYRVGDVLYISKDTLDGSYAPTAAITSIIPDTTTWTEA